MRATTNKRRKRRGEYVNVDGINVRKLTAREVQAFRKGIKTPPYVNAIRLEDKP